MAFFLLLLPDGQRPQQPCILPQPPCAAADGAQLVAAAAQAAVGSICWWCGYGGSLRRLVGANADYVVDGMCRQLRQVRLGEGRLGAWRRVCVAGCGFGLVWHGMKSWRVGMCLACKLSIFQV